MKLFIQPLSKQDANLIAAWRYDPPYDLYNLSLFDIPFLLDPENRYHAVHDEQSRIIGFCCFGAEARVKGGRYEDASPQILDVGVGMHPSYVGGGYGMSFVRSILKYALHEFDPGKFRVTVASFNLRSLRTFQKSGFEETHRFTRERDQIMFVQLESDAISK